MVIVATPTASPFPHPIFTVPPFPAPGVLPQVVRGLHPWCLRRLPGLAEHWPGMWRFQRRGATIKEAYARLARYKVLHNLWYNWQCMVHEQVALKAAVSKHTTWFVLRVWSTSACVLVLLSLASCPDVRVAREMSPLGVSRSPSAMAHLGSKTAL